ncbi:MAG: hypothetical protein ACRECH_03455, partial [Nitrososphaerales archaeon]
CRTITQEVEYRIGWIPYVVFLVRLREIIVRLGPVKIKDAIQYSCMPYRSWNRLHPCLGVYRE